MVPTVQNVTDKAKESNNLQLIDKRSQMLVNVKYSNTLPEIPFDLKYLKCPFPSLRFAEYHPTTLDRQYKYEILNEPDLGVQVDLVNRDAYVPDLNTQLDPSDEQFFVEDLVAPQHSKRSRHHARSVSWLRRTEYISTEQTRFQPQTMDKVEAKVGYNIKKTLVEGILYMDKPSQIKAIEKTFEDSKKNLEKHFSKPNVVAKEIIPVFPDFSIWKYPSAQVIFDTDPAPGGKSVPEQIEQMSQGLLRGVTDESGEAFVAYFIPTQETLEKRRRDAEAGISYVDGQEYEYKLNREYNWNVKSKTSKGYEENYYFVIREDGIHYNELETRVRLSKRRLKIGQSTNNTRLIVKHRPLTNNELKTHRNREKQLESLVYEDESEGKNEEEEKLQPQIRQNREAGLENDVSSRSASVGSRRNSQSRSRSNSRSRSRSKSTSTSKSRSLSPQKSCSRSTSASSKRFSSRSRSRSSSGSRSNSSIVCSSTMKLVSVSKNSSESGAASDHENDSVISRTDSDDSD